MKRNSIYLRQKFSEKELILLKKDLIDNSVHVVLKIKNLNLSKERIEEVVKNAVECVLTPYKFGTEGNLGDLVKTQVIIDLKDYYEKAYPDQVNKVLWPCLNDKRPFDKLVEILRKVKLQSTDKIESIFNEINQNLNIKQQKLLLAIYSNPSISYAEISKQFGKRGVMTYREIKIIYNRLLQVLKDLGIDI